MSRLIWVRMNFLIIPLLLFLATALIRGPDLGNPGYHMDEQFYLLVGRAMTQGAQLYVDIWDRKPPGLFLIYAFTSALGPHDVLQYQLVASLFVWITAVTLTQIARRFVGPVAATLSGLAYIATLESLSGGGGQSPVFYNLFMAQAFFHVLKAVEQTDNGRFTRSTLCAVMLSSLAIFVKETAVFEAIMFGIILLWLRWTRERQTRLVLRDAALYAAIGLAPMGCAAAYFSAYGHFDNFYFANFISIWHKSAYPPSTRYAYLLFDVFCLLPLLICAGFGLRTNGCISYKTALHPMTLLKLWMAVATVGFVVIPNFYDHYALPLVAPMALLAARAFEQKFIGWLGAFIAILWPLHWAHYPHLSRTAQVSAAYARAANDIRTNLYGRCLYVYLGPAALYRESGACRLTRYAFPEHLSTARESGALGIDPALEVRAILVQRPNVIVTAHLPNSETYNTQTKALIESELRQHFSLYDHIALPDSKPGETGIQIWVRSPHA